MSGEYMFLMEARRLTCLVDMRSTARTRVRWPMRLTAGGGYLERDKQECNDTIQTFVIQIWQSE
jgi:hypothetical protein